MTPADIVRQRELGWGWRERGGNVTPLARSDMDALQRALYASGCSRGEVCNLMASLARAARLVRREGALTAIERRVEELACAHPDVLARFRLAVANIRGETEQYTRALYDAQPDQPDDRGYRPTHVDPILQGTARATGQTAAAVRRGRTVTKWQHDERGEAT